MLRQTPEVQEHTNDDSQHFAARLLASVRNQHDYSHDRHHSDQTVKWACVTEKYFDGIGCKRACNN